MKTLNEHLKTKTFKNVYLLYGDEAYLRNQYRDKLKKAMINEGDTMNFSCFEGKGIDEKELTAMADTVPFFSDYRLIIVENSGFFKTSGHETLAEYMKESEAYLDQKEIEKLAVDLDNFSYEYDTYEYKDIVENREEQVKKITEDILNKKTGCLKDWLVEVSEESDIDSDVITARSLLSRLENAETFSIFTRQSEQEQPEATISFYVAECMEFPVMGEYHNNLTLEEAIKIYESIPAERLHGIKGIGFDLQDGDEDYSGEYGLMSGDRIDRDLIDMIPHYKESPLVQKAINDMEKYLNEKHGKVQEAEQTVEVKQEVPEAPVKKESVSVEPNREQNKEPAKGGKGELKKSVLQSLKEFQVRAKAQEQKETATEKSKARKKGEVEL